MIYADFPRSLLVAVSLALLAVRRFPASLARYAVSAENLADRFLEQRRRFERSRRSRPLPPIESLEQLHAAFKDLACPEGAASYHRAVSEAMRCDLEALAAFGRPRRRSSLRAEADRHWRRAADEAERLCAA